MYRRTVDTGDAGRSSSAGNQVRNYTTSIANHRMSSYLSQETPLGADLVEALATRACHRRRHHLAIVDSVAPRTGL